MKVLMKFWSNFDPPFYFSKLCKEAHQILWKFSLRNKIDKKNCKDSFNLTFYLWQTAMNKCETEPKSGGRCQSLKYPQDLLSRDDWGKIVDFYLATMVGGLYELMLTVGTNKPRRQCQKI